jgi:hypothetical protein
VSPFKKAFAVTTAVACMMTGVVGGFCYLGAQPGGGASKEGLATAYQDALGYAKARGHYPATAKALADQIKSVSPTFAVLDHGNVAALKAQPLLEYQTGVLVERSSARSISLVGISDWDTPVRLTASLVGPPHTQVLDHFRFSVANFIWWSLGLAFFVYLMGGLFYVCWDMDIAVARGRWRSVVEPGTTGPLKPAQGYTAFVPFNENRGDHVALFVQQFVWLKKGDSYQWKPTGVAPPPELASVHVALEQGVEKLSDAWFELCLRTAQANREGYRDFAPALARTRQEGIPLLPPAQEIMRAVPPDLT